MSLKTYTIWNIYNNTLRNKSHVHFKYHLINSLRIKQFPFSFFQFTAMCLFFLIRGTPRLESKSNKNRVIVKYVAIIQLFSILLLTLSRAVLFRFKRSIKRQQAFSWTRLTAYGWSSTFLRTKFKTVLLLWSIERLNRPIS